MYFVYILRCKDKSLYTGITTNVERRFKEHKDGTGAKYTKVKGVERVVYIERKKNRSTASKREAEIKGWKKYKKLELIRATESERGSTEASRPNVKLIKMKKF